MPHSELVSVSQQQSCHCEEESNKNKQNPIQSQNLNRPILFFVRIQFLWNSENPKSLRYGFENGIKSRIL